MKYDKIVGLKKQQEKENLEIIQRASKKGADINYCIGKICRGG